MSRLFVYTIFLTLFLGLVTYSQSKYQFTNINKKKTTITFKKVNNLIVLPIIVNGKKLSFILDTGVNKTLIFNLSNTDSLKFVNSKKIMLRGLGSGKTLPAVLTKNNRVSLNNITSNNQTIYVVLDNFVDLSSKMGLTIHGVIGYDLLKDFIVKINYKTNQIQFLNPNKYVLKPSKRRVVLPLEFNKNKPYVNAKVQLNAVTKKHTEVKLLVDSGGSDAFWLFEYSKPNIKTPKKYFKDILGEGLSGTVYGNRSKVPSFKVGRFTIANPTVSFLDSISTKNARRFKSRHGSIGGGVLSRFKVWLDYPNKQIMLKKNGALTKGFYYNMSGLEVVYNGMQLVKELQKRVTAYTSNYKSDQEKATVYVSKYKFKPSFKIKSVLKNSPGAMAGLKAGDIILSLNYKSSEDYKLDEIYRLLQTKPNKKVRLKVLRYGKIQSFSFRLKQRI